MAASLQQSSPAMAQLNARAFLAPAGCFTVSSPAPVSSACSTATPSEASTPPASIVASLPELPQHVVTLAPALATRTIQVNAPKTSSVTILPPQPLAVK